MTPPQSPDAISLAILAELRADGRRPYATIGGNVGLSETAVRHRVHRLVETGVARIVAVTDPDAVGLTRQATIGVKVEGDVQDLADALAGVAEVAAVVITAGTFDLLVEVVCSDDEALLAVITERIRPLPGVATTETFVHLRTLARAPIYRRLSADPSEPMS